MPRIETSDGWRTLFAEGLDPRKLMTADQLKTAVVGGYDIESRVRDQERDGVSAEVIFPTFALQACFASDDPRCSSQLCRAYNGWAADVFAGHPTCSRSARCRCSTSTTASPRRSASPRPASARSFLPARVAGRPYNDAEYDRFWAVAEELGLPLTFHSGTGYEPRIVRGPGGAVINYLMGAQLDGPMVILSLAAGGALDRFPDLRVVTVETGASWLGWIMTQADSIYVDHAMYARPKLSMLAERVDPAPVRGHVHVRPGRDQQPPHHRPRHPHVGQRLPAPRGHVADVAGGRADQFDGVPDDEVRAIVGGNAARVFGFDGFGFDLA